MTIGEYVPNLKACPFCGAAATYGTKIEDNSNGPDANLVMVGCEDCGVAMETYVSRHIRGHDAFFRVHSGARWGDWGKLKQSERVTWEQQADNRNASYDIEGYRELEEKWNRRDGA